MGTPCSDVVATATDFRLFNTSHTAHRGTQDSGMGASSGSNVDGAIVSDPLVPRLAARCPIPPLARSRLRLQRCLTSRSCPTYPHGQHAGQVLASWHVRVSAPPVGVTRHDSPMISDDSADKVAADIGGKAIAAVAGGAVGGMPGALVAVALEPIFVHLV